MRFDAERLLGLNMASAPFRIGETIIKVVVRAAFPQQRQSPLPVPAILNHRRACVVLRDNDVALDARSGHGIYLQADIAAHDALRPDRARLDRRSAMILLTI